MTKVLDQESYGETHLEPLGLLAGGIAHDFNNLLTAILGNASLAHKHIESPEQLDIYLSRIQEASLSAAGLCKQMLTYAGKRGAVSGNTNVSVAVEEVSRLIEVSLGKDVSIAYDLTCHLPAVGVDEYQIQQILMNLMMNANESMEQSGRIMISTGIMQVDEHTPFLYSKNSPAYGEYVYIKVSDEGCGMDADAQAKIFTPFYTTKQSGHGLGMSNILGVVCGHDGVMQVESEAGKGSRISAAFPAVQQQNQDDVMVKEYDALHKIPLDGKVLLVDDEEIVLEIMQVMLEDLGCETIVAQNGEEAIDVYQKNQADISLVLLDLSMPKLSGKECVLALQELNSDVKIILSSGYSEEDVMNQFKGIPLAGFLQKPCNLKQLHDAVRRAL